MTFQERINKHMQHYAHVKVPEGDHTIGALIQSIMEIDTEEDAKEFRDGYTDYLAIKLPDEDSRTIARSNIGWGFGEGMASERVAMWVKVCEASHPVFGQVKPTQAAAFQAGIDAAKEA